MHARVSLAVAGWHDLSWHKQISFSIQVTCTYFENPHNGFCGTSIGQGAYTLCFYFEQNLRGCQKSHARKNISGSVYTYVAGIFQLLKLLVVMW